MNRLFRRNCHAPGFSDLDAHARRQRLRSWATAFYVVATTLALTAVVGTPENPLLWSILLLSAGTVLDRLS